MHDETGGETAPKTLLLGALFSQQTVSLHQAEKSCLSQGDVITLLLLLP